MTQTPEGNTFWARLTARMAEKWPDRFPSAGAVTQKGAASLIHLSQNAGFKWKHGMLPEPKHLAALAVKLGVGVEWLQTGRGPKFVPDPQDPLMHEILRIATDLDELQRMEALKYLQYIASESQPHIVRLPTRSPQRR